MDLRNWQVSNSFTEENHWIDDEIEKIYGEERKFTQEFSVWKYRNIEQGYLGFHTYFDCPIIVLIAKVLELRKQGKVEKTMKDLFGDVRTCILKNYVHYNETKCYKVC